MDWNEPSTDRLKWTHAEIFVIPGVRRWRAYLEKTRSKNLTAPWRCCRYHRGHKGLYGFLSPVTTQKSRLICRRAERIIDAGIQEVASVIKRQEFTWWLNLLVNMQNILELNMSLKTHFKFNLILRNLSCPAPVSNQTRL